MHGIKHVNTHAQGQGPSKSEARIVLIDDCPHFCRIMEAAAKRQGLYLKAYSSLADMYTIANLKNFDLALIDYHLDSFCGLEIAEYVDIFFQDLPVVIVSGDDVPRKKPWPESVKGFLTKSLGAQEILQRALAIGEKCRLYQMLERGTIAGNAI
ncbi:MAG: response regulator [Oligoflexales bacterium]